MELLTNNHEASGDSASGVQLYLRLPSMRALLPVTCKIVSMAATGLEDSESPKVALVLREVLANAMVHGNGNDAHRMVELRVRRVGNRQVEISVSDEGPGFDTSQLDLSLPDAPTEHHRGGLRLVNALSEELHFENGGSKVVCLLSWDTNLHTAEFTNRHYNV